MAPVRYIIAGAIILVPYHSCEVTAAHFEDQVLIDLTKWNDTSLVAPVVAT